MALTTMEHDQTALFVGRVSRPVVKALDEIAQANYRSRSAEIRHALAEHVRREGTPVSGTPEPVGRAGS